MALTISCRIYTTPVDSTIGFGDGSWGAFYDVCTLYPLRTAIFGFGSQLQLIHGRYDPDGAFNPGPFAEALTLPDTYGRRFEGPRYRGVRTFDDCMLFLPPQGKALSFYEHAMQRQAGFGTQQRVKRIEKRENGIRVHYTVGADTAMAYEDFDSVVVTVPSWILEVDVER